MTSNMANIAVNRICHFHHSSSLKEEGSETKARKLFEIIIQADCASLFIHELHFYNFFLRQNFRGFPKSFVDVMLDGICWSYVLKGIQAGTFGNYSSRCILVKFQRDSVFNVDIWTLLTQVWFLFWKLCLWFWAEEVGQADE